MRRGYCSLRDGWASVMETLPGTSTTGSQLRHPDGREFTGRVSELLPAGPPVSISSVYQVASAVLHLLLQQRPSTRQFPNRLRSRLLRDRLRCWSMMTCSMQCFNWKLTVNDISLLAKTPRQYCQYDTTIQLTLWRPLLPYMGTAIKHLYSCARPG